MHQSDLQRLYDDNEDAHQRRLADHAAALAARAASPAARTEPAPDQPEKDYVKVRYGDNPGWVATYSGETPRRYLVRLERPVDDPDHPDFGPTTSVWFPASALEAG